MFGDLSQLGLTSAATVIGDVAAKSILAAAATADKGAHASVDKKFLQEQSTAALVIQMEALRKEAMQPIEIGFGQDVSAYPLETGLRDVLNYHRKGSILAALGSISGNAHNAIVKSDAETKMNRQAAASK